jgi:exosortase A
MSARSLPATMSPDANRIAADAVPALLVGLVVLGFLFRTEAMAAYQVWNDSTAYSHCFFVLPIALYLAWDRRHNLAGLRVEPLPWLGLLAIPGTIAWMAAERLGIMEGRQLVAMSFVQLLFLVVLGWRVWWAMSAPLLYLYFLVPFGAFLTPALQKFTLEFSLIGLQVTGVPFYADEFLIDTPSGRYFVAEACAGLRFLIASIAFGVLYSMLIYRSYKKRALFMVASIVIPIVANGFRALGIVLLGEALGSAQAAAADHILYGWIFFSIVILLLILAGMPFREDTVTTVQEAKPAPERLPAARLRAVLASLLVVVFAGSAAAASAWLDGRAVPVASVSPPTFHSAAGCISTGPVIMHPPGTPGAAHPQGSRSVQEFICGNVRLAMTVQVFSTRANPAAIGQARRELAREDSSEELEFGSLAVPGGDPASWRLVIGNTPPVMAATALWVEGQPSRGGLAERILQARNSVQGAPAATVLVAAALHFPQGTLASSERDQAQRMLATFLAHQGALGPQITALAHAAAGN